MTRDDIIRSAREIATQCCNRMPCWQQDYAMTRIMELIEASAAAEREACAKVCDDSCVGDNSREDMEARRCAAAIRARGQA